MEHDSYRQEHEGPGVGDGLADQLEDSTVKFSRGWTLVCTVIVLGGIGLLVWSYSMRATLERVEKPERALAHIASRSMLLESSLSQVSPWERYVHRALNGEEETVQPLVQWYSELAHESDDSVNALYAGVLEAEAGHVDRMKKRGATWDVEDERRQLFRDILEAAYGGKAHTPEGIHRLQARLAEEVPDNWFYRRLAFQLATQAHDTAFVRMTQDHVQSRQNQLVWRNRLLIFIEVGGALVSLAALVTLLWIRYRKGADGLVIGHAALPPPWKGGDGFAVLMRGAAVTLLLLSGMGAFLGAYFSFMSSDVNERLIELISTVMLYVPIPLLLYYYLLRPKGYSLRHVFGCQLRHARVGVFSLTVLALFACGLFGDVVVSFAGDVVGQSTHWTEWFHNSLVWGNETELFMLFVEVAVLAPIFEEIIFRGIVYASLRRRFGWILSAVLSAAIFALVHGYGMVGLLAVGWSGFLWAWAYEKTGSLLPGIAAHALNNFVFLASLLVVFR